jgi:hypothetical protein
MRQVEILLRIAFAGLLILPGIWFHHAAPEAAGPRRVPASEWSDVDCRTFMGYVMPPTPTAVQQPGAAKYVPHGLLNHGVGGNSLENFSGVKIHSANRCYCARLLNHS